MTKIKIKMLKKKKNQKKGKKNSKSEYWPILES